MAVPKLFSKEGYMTTAFFQLNTMTYDYPTPTSAKFDEMANITLDGATEKNIITLKKHFLNSSLFPWFSFTNPCTFGRGWPSAGNMGVSKRLWMSHSCVYLRSCFPFFLHHYLKWSFMIRSVVQDKRFYLQLSLVLSIIDWFLYDHFKHVRTKTWEEQWKRKEKKPLTRNSFNK